MAGYYRIALVLAFAVSGCSPATDVPSVAPTVPVQLTSVPLAARTLPPTTDAATIAAATVTPSRTAAPAPFPTASATPIPVAVEMCRAFAALVPTFLWSALAVFAFACALFTLCIAAVSSRIIWDMFGLLLPTS